MSSVHDGGLEEALRALPGVMGCSMAPEGVAILVHPEVDARALKARAEAVCQAHGDPRPLIVVGGLVPAPPARGAFGVLLRRERPLSLVVFAVLVLVALAVLPSTRRHRGTGELAT